MQNSEDEIKVSNVHSTHAYNDNMNTFAISVNRQILRFIVHVKS